MLVLPLISLFSLAGLKLQKVILLSRHGIRTPYGADYLNEENFEVFSTRPGARWGDVISSGGFHLSTPTSYCCKIPEHIPLSARR